MRTVAAPAYKEYPNFLTAFILSLLPLLPLLMPKRFACDYPGCGKTVAHAQSLPRHKQTHCNYSDRLYSCPYVGCGVRSNQKGTIKNHIRSQHLHIPFPCRFPGCLETFPDPAGVSRHQIGDHGFRLAAHSTGVGEDEDGSRSPPPMTSTPNKELNRKSWRREHRLPPPSRLTGLFEPNRREWYELPPLRVRGRGQHDQSPLFLSYIYGPLRPSDQPRMAHPWEYRERRPPPR